MDEIYIENKTFGKCTVICFFRDVAIVELPRDYEKFVVTIGLSIKNNRWNRGFYCKSFKDAGVVFNNLLEDFYMVSLKV